MASRVTIRNNAHYSIVGLVDGSFAARSNEDNSDRQLTKDKTAADNRGNADKEAKDHYCTLQKSVPVNLHLRSFLDLVFYSKSAQFQPVPVVLRMFCILKHSNTLRSVGGPTTAAVFAWTVRLSVGRHSFSQRSHSLSLLLPVHKQVTCPRFLAHAAVAAATAAITVRLLAAGTMMRLVFKPASATSSSLRPQVRSQHDSPSNQRVGALITAMAAAAVEAAIAADCEQAPKSLKSLPF